MKLLIDTNIVLDVLLRREPFCTGSTNVIKLAQREDIEEFISASAATDLYYISYRQLRDKSLVRELLKQLLRVVSVATVSEDEITMALNLPWGDFEDSVQYAVTLGGEMDGIVTKNPDDYKYSDLPVWLPEQVLNEVL